MKHEIIMRPSYSALRAVLSSGEALHAESGALLSMDASATIEGNMKGGLWKAAKRAVLTSESFFVTTITATENDTEVLLAPRATGDIEAIELHGEDYLVQGGSFLASIGQIETDSKFTGFKGFLTGDGIFMISAHGTGTMFVSSFGGIVKKEIPAGKQYIVDNGHIVAFSKKIQFTMAKVGTGMMNMVTTGEGLSCVFTGPGTIYMQTRNMRTFAESLNPFLPQRSKAQGAGLLGNVFGG